jgi:hypothetical protein
MSLRVRAHPRKGKRQNRFVRPASPSFARRLCLPFIIGFLPIKRLATFYQSGSFPLVEKSPERGWVKLTDGVMCFITPIRGGCARLCGLVMKTQVRIFIDKEFILGKIKNTIYNKQYFVKISFHFFPTTRSLEEGNKTVA